MSNPFTQQVYVHKHYHYHYYDNGVETVEGSLMERYSSPSISTPQKTHQGNSGILPTRSNWKNKINPQVTQLYQQINQKPFIIPTFTPTSPRNVSKSPNLFQSDKQKYTQKYSNSKQDLLNQIERYQEYLRKTSRPNLYIPKSENLKKLLTKRENQSQQKSRETLVSLNQLLQINQNPQKNGGKYTQDDMAMTRAGSKMFSTKQEIDHQSDQNQYTMRDSQLRINNPKRQKQLKQLKRVRSSEIKSPTKNNINNVANIYYNNDAKIGMSYMQQPSNNIDTKEYSQQQHSFSLFQQSVQQQQKKQHKIYNNQNDQSYSYEVIKEQCEYLRKKFIQHIQQKHGFVKF